MLSGKKTCLFACVFCFFINHLPLFAIEKEYVSSQKLLESSFMLSKKIYDSKFRPTVLIALWRGGAPIGISITEFFAYKGESISNHYAIKTSSYHLYDQKSTIAVFGLEEIAEMIRKDDKILIVDDLVDSGKTIQKVLDELALLCKERLPEQSNIKVATIYCKPKNTCIFPDYYLYETDSWLVFPHELECLTQDEILIFQGEKVLHLLEEN